MLPCSHYLPGMLATFHEASPALDCRCLPFWHLILPRGRNVQSSVLRNSARQPRGYGVFRVSVFGGVRSLGGLGKGSASCVRTLDSMHYHSSLIPPLTPPSFGVLPGLGKPARLPRTVARAKWEGFGVGLTSLNLPLPPPQFRRSRSRCLVVGIS